MHPRISAPSAPAVAGPRGLVRPYNEVWIIKWSSTTKVSKDLAHRSFAKCSQTCTQSFNIPGVWVSFDLSYQDKKEQISVGPSENLGAALQLQHELQ